MFDGQHDTRIETGENYATISLAEVFAMPPSARDKRHSPACIPSGYCGHDAREHARQREVGSFVALCGDVDRGIPTLILVTVVIGVVPSIFLSGIHNVLMRIARALEDKR